MASTAASEARAGTRRAACEWQRARKPMPLCSGQSLRREAGCEPIRADHVTGRRTQWQSWLEESLTESAVAAAIPWVTVIHGSIATRVSVCADVLRACHRAHR